MSYYFYVTKNRQICYYASQTRIKNRKDFVSLVKKRGNPNVVESAVAEGSKLPNCKTKIDVTKKNSMLETMMEISENNLLQAQIVGRIDEKLREDGTLDEIKSTFVEVASEFGIDLTKDEIEEAIAAEPDAEVRGGALIVYANYLIVS